MPEDSDRAEEPVLGYSGEDAEVRNLPRAFASMRRREGSKKGESELVPMAGWAGNASCGRRGCGMVLKGTLACCEGRWGENFKGAWPKETTSGREREHRERCQKSVGVSSTMRPSGS